MKIQHLQWSIIKLQQHIGPYKIKTANNMCSYMKIQQYIEIENNTTYV